MLSTLYSLFRVLGKILLAAYFVLALAFLGLRYAVLPNIDTWRDQIAAQASTLLGTQVQIGEVSAQWKGLHPRVALTDVTLSERQGDQVLRLPDVQAVISWRSLLDLAPSFARLDISGLELSMRRDGANRLWILGKPYRLDAKDDEPILDDQAIEWLLSNRQVTLRGGVLSWTDERRSAPDLVLRDVDLVLQNDGKRHALSLSADLPAALGSRMQLSGRFHFGAGAAHRRLAWDELGGELYLDIQDMRPLGWQPWVDQPQNLASGQVSARAWLGVREGKPDVLIWDAKIGDGHWVFDEQNEIRADFLHFYSKGSWAAYRQVFDRELLAAKPDDLEISIRARDWRGEAKSEFAHALTFDGIDYQGAARRRMNGLLSVRASRLELDNADLLAVMRGLWTQADGDSAGTLDLEGSLMRGRAEAIVDYLPLTVDEDARRWMASGILAGALSDTRFMVKGELDHFPFQAEPDKGDFLLEGAFKDGVIDYVPAENGEPGWPRLEALRGSVRLHRADLRIQAPQGLMRPTADHVIDIKDVAARIPDIEQGSVLTVSGATRARGADYLALAAHSPLGKLLDGALDEVSGAGDWRVPLTLTVPLFDPEATTVEGEVQFQGGDLRFMPGMPLFEHVQGKLHFTQAGVQARQVRGRLLGGELAVSGGLGSAQPGLTLRGSATAAALTEYVGLAGMKRLRGQAPYVATVRGGLDGPAHVAIASSLQGMALDLPPPFGKSAPEALKVEATWKSDEKRKGDMVLNLDAGHGLATFLRKRDDGQAPYFRAGAIGVGQAPSLPEQGLTIDILYPEFDGDVWNEVADEFSQPLREGEPTPSVFPEIGQVRLQAEKARIYGVPLDQLTYTASRPGPQQWRVDISSSQTAGTLFWREAQGRVAGQVDAKFDRLDLGQDPSLSEEEKSAVKETVPTVSDDFDIPAINLYVKHFRLYGHHVGELSLVGINQARGDVWSLEQVKLSSPHANLTGSGAWRLSGPQRGLSVNANVQVQDMGAYLDQLGYGELMQGGQGTLHGNFRWRNLPWEYSKSDLSGHVILELDKGRFSSLGSRSARLLELLSLQSIRRLATLDLNVRGVTKEGFPFDTLRGDLQIDKGILSTPGYRVSGPIGTIVIDGKANWLDETLDLRAAVAPHLDASGAAVAAGIALNPIVGVGAFLAQWLLQMSLRDVMAVEYRIHGTWDDPVLEDVPAKKEAMRESPGTQDIAP